MASQPNAIDQAADILMTQWRDKPLENLRTQARGEKTGIAFDAIRESTGRRLIMVMCVTGPQNIALLHKVFDFRSELPDEDWTKLSITDVIVRAMQGPGFAFEGLRDSKGDYTDILLVSTEPVSMQLIQRVFTLPA